MKVGFYSKHAIGADFINGDEILSKELIKGLKEIDSSVEGFIYAPNARPTDDTNLDFMIWLGDNIQDMDFNIANKNLFYLQSGLPEDNVRVVFTRDFDGVLTYSYDAMELYKGLWKNVMYLPLCADTDVYHPVEKKKEFAYDVSYVGGSWKDTYLYEKYLVPAIKYKFGLYGSWKEEKKRAKERRKAIKKLFHDIVRLNLKPIIRDIKIILPDFMDKLSSLCKGKISNEDIAALYCSSKINLNFATELMLKDNTITGRTFEILACKGFCISDKTPFAEETLKDCVVFTDGGEDLKKKIEYYLAHPEEREKIAENGYNWVMKNVTYKIVAQKLYDYLKEMEG